MREKIAWLELPGSDREVTSDDDDRDSDEESSPRSAGYGKYSYD